MVSVPGIGNVYTTTVRGVECTRAARTFVVARHLDGSGLFAKGKRVQLIGMATGAGRSAERIKRTVERRHAKRAQRAAGKLEGPRGAPKTVGDLLSRFIENKAAAGRVGVETMRRCWSADRDHLTLHIGSIPPFHAWRKLLFGVSVKVQNMRKKLIVVSLAGSLSLGLASCAGGIQPDSPELPNPGPTSSAPVDEETIRIGDAVLSGEVVTDEHGTYARTTIAPDGDSMQYDPTIVDSSATDRFSQEDILSGQQFVSRFIAEEALDSIALEGQEANKAEWANTVADEYLDPRYKDDILAPSGTGNVSTVIVQGGTSTLPLLVRDGNARLSAQSVRVERIVGFDEGDLQGLTYSGTASATYRASDAASVELLQRINPEASLERILERASALRDNTGENSIAVSVKYNYSLIKDPQNMWRIGGYQNDVDTDLLL